MQLKVEDEFGNESFDIRKIEVDSSAPIPSFQILPLADREKPSQFVLDASGTQDSDVGFGVDELNYSWTFSNPSGVTVNKTEETGEKIVVTYDEVGTHKIKLTVRDKYGLTESVEKTVNVESVLRPEIFPNPITSKWGEEISFSSKANKTVTRYNRDFGDGGIISSVT